MQNNVWLFRLLNLPRAFLCVLGYGVFGVLLSMGACAVDMSGDQGSVGFDGDRYRLGAGDVISITVYGEDDLSRKNLQLTDSGIISFPTGEVAALGLTMQELQVKIEDILRGGYLLNPKVSVAIETYRSFFIGGQVVDPGAYPYKPGMTVRKAVTLAGGFKERASQDKIYIMREQDVMRSQSSIGLDGAVLPGDTITVEESFF